MKKKTTDLPSDSSGLETNLKQADPEIQDFIAALKAENLKLQKKIAKLEAEKITLQNRIAVLEEKYSKYINHDESFVKEKKKVALMSDDELSDYIQKDLLKTKK
ncbi:MAG: hypothetical protein L6Q29_03300 [Candidatus Pacebacteria bacterium]|nr:hypothetical protein [Candidatus Paceibacterota bacterium]